MKKMEYVKLATCVAGLLGSTVLEFVGFGYTLKAQKNYNEYKEIEKSPIVAVDKNLIRESLEEKLNEYEKNLNSAAAYTVAGIGLAVSIPGLIGVETAIENGRKEDEVVSEEPQIQ